jgi:hypothetical protein
MRSDADGMATLLATPGDYLGRAGSQWPLTGDDIAVARVYCAGRAARADYTAGDFAPLAEAARRGDTLFPAAVPVVVDGGLWGAMSVGSRGLQPPPDLEGRLAKFTELLAAVIANAESRADLAASRQRSKGAAMRSVRDVGRGRPDAGFGLARTADFRVGQRTNSRAGGDDSGCSFADADGLTHRGGEMRSERAHSRSRVIKFRIRRGSHRLVACSVCLRVREGEAWIEAGDVIRRLRTFEHEDVVRLCGALCDRCALELRLRRRRSVEGLAA